MTAVLGVVAWVILLALALVGCAGPAGGQQQASQGAARTEPKTLTIGLLREPASIEGFTGQGGTADGASEVRNFIHNHLTRMDPQEVLHPELAAEVPSTAKGTWRVNADGSMDVTWTLRPGVKWQDGEPFASADLRFSMALHKDPDLAHAYKAETRIMESATTPDPHTFVIHWSSIYVQADRARGLPPMPRHLLEGLYQSPDREGFVNSSRFTSEFVGLGPYRMLRWDPGSSMEFAPFDGYFLGQPPLDRVFVRFIFDAATLAANILAGGVDVIIPPALDLDAALEIKRRWEGTGNRVIVEPVARITYFELQYRPEMARPRFGPTLLPVRQALYHAIDRQGLAQVMTQGLAPTADSWFRPGDPVRSQIEAAIPQYPYDPARALALLSQAGWERGADGVLVHRQSGERFAFDIWSVPQTGEKPAVLIANDWKAIGVEAGVHVIPPADAQDRQITATYPAMLLTGSFVEQLLDRLDSRDIASAANRWSGRDRGAYVNPKVDAILDRLRVAIDPGERVSGYRDSAQEVMGDLALIPLIWEVRPILAVASVKADLHPNNSGWNAFEWDKS